MKKYFILLMLALIAVSPTVGLAKDKRIVMIAGKPSHGPGQHEHNAGLLLLQKCLADFPGIKVEVYAGGWPSNSAVLEGAAAVVIYSDGGEGHPALQDDHLQRLGALMKKGVGLALFHYGVEPTIEKGQAEFLDWIGGCFEIDRSVNPHWEADFKTLPEHPITRGVKPFKLDDEWYFNMRFRDEMKGVTPILSAVAPPSTMRRADGPHEGNPGVRESVRRGDPQNVVWTSERGEVERGIGNKLKNFWQRLRNKSEPDEYGRGFGFTGGHFHRNWGNDDFRKVALNGILWVAKVEVPPDGVKSTVTAADLAANLDKK